jgi:methyl-accepting chemotaxis protein
MVSSDRDPAIRARNNAAPLDAYIANACAIVELAKTDSAAAGAGFAEFIRNFEALSTGDTTTEIPARPAVTGRGKIKQDLAHGCEVSVGGIVTAVSTAATELQVTAQSLSQTADLAYRQSQVVASASQQTTDNVQSVAAATEQLSASITEIGNQFDRLSDAIAGAVMQAGQTNEKIKALAAASQRIGTVSTLINEIAGQTNLLARNATIEATIEATRAGEPGRGAVVAAEVRSLATQTASATEEIAGQVRAIQEATRLSTEAIEEITLTINREQEFGMSISSAVSQRAAATQEISRNVQQASASTSEVSVNINGVTEASAATSSGLAAVLDAAAQLTESGERLRRDVEDFLLTVRSA